MVTYYGILGLSAALSIFFRLGGAIFRRNIIVQRGNTSITFEKDAGPICWLRYSIFGKLATVSRLFYIALDCVNKSKHRLTSADIETKVNDLV